MHRLYLFTLIQDHGACSLSEAVAWSYYTIYSGWAMSSTAFQAPRSMALFMLEQERKMWICLSCCESDWDEALMFEMLLFDSRPPCAHNAQND